MPRKLSWRLRSERLLRAFLKAQKAHAKRSRQRILHEKRNLQRAGLRGAVHESSSSSSDSESIASVVSLGLSMASDDSESYSDTLSTTSSEDSPDSGSTNSSQTSEDMEDAIALMEVDAAINSSYLKQIGWWEWSLIFFVNF